LRLQLRSPGPKLGVSEERSAHLDWSDAVLSSKLSVGIHIMTIFGLKPNEPLTSEFIAASVNTNPVVIRRLLGSLREAGIVESKTGVGGGWSLLKDPAKITLLDILRAVEPQGEIFALHRSEPNPECPCGEHIQSILTDVYDRVRDGVSRQLEEITIACIAGKIMERIEV
jgi:Rrf2 family protein